jgi:exopolyphosphatase / guanosine-5'-triphosphate,3'-diphosphate pyrophosphatase
VNSQNRPKQIAAVDLGSNSFHMIVAEIRADELIVLDRLREMVRLGSGLTKEGLLTEAIQERALECLERFGQRLRHLSHSNVRIVGTNTLRAAQNSAPLLARATEALGHPIEIISGIEEARLIYQGVSLNLPTDGRRRMVMDIGGGSTEYIIGVDRTPLQKESLRMGCVSMSMAHFPEGKITAKRFRKAALSAEQELEPFQHLYHSQQWSSAIGASGTLKTTQKLLQSRGLSRNGISREGLNRLVEQVIAAGRLTPALFPDLDPERFPSFPGGLAIIKATFDTLGIEHMNVSDGALREGLLQDILGRINHEDVRDRTVHALAFRYHVEMEHARLIQSTARELFAQINLPTEMDREVAAQWLDWASILHDIGRDIAHSGYHKHGAYILENADLPGFSRPDQQVIALLVRAHRRKFPERLFKDLPQPLETGLRQLALLLRIAVLVHRSRALQVTPRIKIRIQPGQVTLGFPTGWLDAHPLTVADLEQEVQLLDQVHVALSFA